jgi:hypothetical protein
MTLKGYPGLERFFLPAAAVTCVLAGVGVIKLAQLAGEGVARLGAAASLVPVVTAAVAVILVAISIPSSSDAITAARQAFPANSQDAATQKQLSAAVKAVGGHDAVCFAAVNHGMQTALAWKLHVTLEKVGTAMREPGVDFIGPHNGADGEAAAVDSRLTHERPLGQSGSWRIVQLTDPRLPTACDGH